MKEIKLVKEIKIISQDSQEPIEYIDGWIGG
jgi:hypothetical protein